MENQIFSSEGSMVYQGRVSNCAYEAVRIVIAPNKPKRVFFLEGGAWFKGLNRHADKWVAEIKAGLK